MASTRRLNRPEPWYGEETLHCQDLDVNARSSDTLPMRWARFSWIWLSLVACKAPTSDETDSSGLDSVVEVQAVNVGQWQVNVERPSLTLCNGCDVGLDWSQLTHDLVGNLMDPLEDATQLSLYVFDSNDADALAQEFVSQTLDSSQLTARWNCPVSDSQAQLSDCAFVGHSLIPETYFVDDWAEHWMLLLYGGTPNRLRTLVDLHPTPNEAANQVVLQGQAARLEGQLSWEEAMPLEVGSNTMLDWSALEVDSWGGPIGQSSIDEMRIDRLEEGVSEVAANRDAWNTLSLEHWTAVPFDSSSVDFREWQGATPWTGLDDSGTWVLSAWCSSCPLDLPVWVIPLQP